MSASASTVPQASPPSPAQPASGPRVATASTGTATADEIRSVRRAIEVGLVVWPSFFLLDVFMQQALYPDASLGLFLSFRVLGWLGILVAWLVVRRESPSRRSLVLANGGMCLMAAVMVSIMSLQLGGPTSAYVHGISLIILVEGAAVAAPWYRSFLVMIPTAVAYPALMAGAAAFDPTVHAALATADGLAAFGAQYVFVIASLVIATSIAHSVWSARRELRETRRLRRYRLEAPIGKGGMNEVWLAWDDGLRRQLALKILQADCQPSALSRFEREAHATSQLRSPHTVRIYDYGASDDGIYFIAMEYLAGMDLHQMTRRYGPLPASRAVHFGVQACRSLAEAHDRGIVHRDIKPANLFVTPLDDDEDGLKVLDFGIARVRQAQTHLTLSSPGAAIGTPAYMAPEVLQGATADERSDVYSLGATLYELLTGVPPFVAETTAALFVAHLSEPPVPPSVRRGGSLPARLEELVLSCLDKDPEARPADARALLAQLDSCLDVPKWTLDEARAWWRAVRIDPLGSSAEIPAPLQTTARPAARMLAR